MKSLTSDWFAKNRLVILILSLIIGIISVYFKADLFMIPFMGIIFFFIPNILRHRELKEVYYLQIARFFLTCMSLVAFLFTYKFFEDIVGGKKSVTSAFNEFKSTILIFLVLYAMFFLVTLAFGFLWKRSLNFNRVHLQVLINQLSMPIIAFVILTLSFYLYFTDQLNAQKDDIQWYVLLVLPALLIIPWSFHMFGLLKLAKERGMPLPQFLYSYERTRFESPGKFSEFQIYSTKLWTWVFLLSLGVLFFYQMFVDKDFEAIIAGLFVVSVVIFKVYRRGRPGN